MRKINMVIYSLLACGALSGMVAQNAYCATDDGTVTGTAEAQLKYVFATEQTGQQSKDPADNAACKKQTSEPNSKYLGITVVSDYSINPTTLIMSASSKLPSPQSTQPLKLTIKLSALGISGQYAFGAFHPAELPNTYVLFSINTDFKLPKSSILVINDGKKYNCLVTSDPTPFGSALQSKYSADQK